jgi:hypothetical protein
MQNHKNNLSSFSEQIDQIEESVSRLGERLFVKKKKKINATVPVQNIDQIEKNVYRLPVGEKLFVQINQYK